jgi:hypothetical protein
MNQNELRDLLLSMAAEASVAYDKALFDRNSKFNELSLMGKRLDELKEQSRDAVFSPRNNLSSYDTRLTLEQEYEKLKLELAELDSICDSRLNRKEELLEGVELLDSILEEREEYLSKSVSESEEKDDIDEADNDEVCKEDIDSSSAEEQSSGEDSSDEEEDDVVTMDPDKEELKKVISYLAHQCGEIADHTVLDPYRARNELRGICVKWSD